MAERMHRTQILLEPDQHRTLREIAHAEGRSISELVRAVLREYLVDRERAAEEDLTRYLAGLERIRQHREAILARRGGKPLEIDIVETINRMREERDERNLAGSYLEGD
jgi:hypothetical protein